MRHLRLLILLVAAVLVGGCELRSHIDVRLSDGTAGTLSAELGFDAQLRRALATLGGGGDFVAGIERDAEDMGWDVTDFVDGEINGIRLKRDFASLEELNQILGQGLGSGPQEGFVGGLAFIDQGDTIRFEASMPSFQDLAGPMMGLGGEMRVDARISVSFPGEVIDHNGELEGRRVTWTVAGPKQVGGEMFAEARKGGVDWPVLAGAVLAVGVVGLAAWRLVSDRRAAPSDPPPLVSVTTGEGEG
ncbi:MAG: LppM family (lipo)protein [Actinomycetota bacterium]